MIPNRGAAGLTAMWSTGDWRAHMSPTRFAILFAATAAALLLGAGDLADLYCHSLAAPANWALGAENLPVTITGSQSASTQLSLMAAGQSLPFHLVGVESLFAVPMTGVALLLVVPGASVGARLRWCVLVACLIWLSHAVAFYGLVYGSLGKMFASLSTELQHHALAGPWASFSPTRASLCGPLASAWMACGAPALIVLLWVLALPARFWKAS